MATITKFEELEIWQLARQLSKKVFTLTEKEKFNKDFGIRNQIRRSVMDNISEGFGRGGNKEFITFLCYSIGSCSETQSQFYRALDYDYISQIEFDESYILAKTIINKTGSFVTYLNKSNVKGEKFKHRTETNHKPQTKMYNKLKNKEAKIAIIGLGYVGLPIALAFAKKIKVIGFDINEERIKMMQKNIDPSKELEAKDFEGCDIEFTNSIDVLKQANFFIIAVPTDIDEHKRPDLNPLYGASVTVGKAIKKGDYVVYESTVYPGCTEEECIPVIEDVSGLKFKTDFKVGYSPERINPGDKEHTITKILKIVSGCDDESLETIANIYKIIVEPGVHKAPSIKVAEAAKIIENTQRDVNIALMNELSIIFSRIGINTYDVLEAAGTKWNFLKFFPGLVGGHCIGVDPYYLTYKAEALGYHARVINSGRYINDSMGFYIAKQTVKKIIAAHKNISESRVLIMGATFKENVSDIRNSKVCDIIREFKSFGVSVDVIDPHASSEDLKHEYGFELMEKPGKKYDAIVIAVNHREYLHLDEAYYKSILSDGGILVDVKGVLRNKIKELSYWSL